jgi:hypothetical protein
MHVLEKYDPDLKQSTLEASSESDRTTSGSVQRTLL